MIFTIFKVAFLHPTDPEFVEESGLMISRKSREAAREAPVVQAEGLRTSSY